MKKKYFITIALVLMLLLGSIFSLGACDGAVIEAPGAEPSSLIPIRNGSQDIGKASKQWDDLFLNGYLYTENGTATITLPNATGTLAVLAGQTFTGTTTIDDFVADNITVTGGTVTGVTFTTNTYSGTTTINTLVSSNFTRTGGTDTGVTYASPTFTGTPVNANSASGNVSFASGLGAVDVTHGLGTAPAIILFSYAGTPGNNTSNLYSGNVSSTIFTVYATANPSATAVIHWRAYIVSE